MKRTLCFHHIPAVFVVTAVLWTPSNLPATNPAGATPPGNRKPASGQRASALPQVDFGDLPKVQMDKLPVGLDGKRIVAVVNGTTITESRFLAELRLAEIQQRFVPQDARMGLRGALAIPVLDRLVANELVSAYARDKGITVSDEEVQRAIDETNKTMGAGNKLQDIAVNLGMKMDELKDQICVQQLSARVEEQLGSGVAPATAEELRLFVQANPGAIAKREEIHACHIVFQAKPGDTTKSVERSRSLATALLKEIREGADFCEAAARHSQDAKTARKCGDLGFFSRGKMYPEFDKAAFTLAPGQVSDVVRTPVGFHIILVREKNSTNAQEVYRAHKQREAFMAWYENLRRNAKIEKYL
jgi:peptidyl-prolyl cis-trans isomerase C